MPPITSTTINYKWHPFPSTIANAAVSYCLMNIIKEISTPISIGEFLDKLTILEIKSEKIKTKEKLKNIQKELDLLYATWTNSGLSFNGIHEEFHILKQINLQLWKIEDDIRLLEADRNFGEQFIDLSRSVYKVNDQRADIKRKINQKMGSTLNEEKYYTAY